MLSASLAAQNEPDAIQSRTDLRAMLNLIPQDAYPVRRVWPEIERAWGDPFWSYLTVAAIEFLRTQVGPLLRLAAEVDVAIEMYDLVSRTDPAYVSAMFGLARCHHAKGERRAAVAALERIPQSSALFLRARIESARTLIRQDHNAPSADELAAASSVAESLSLEGMSKFTLASQILAAALNLLHAQQVKENDTIRLFGTPLQETRLRAELETTLRSMARLVNGEERIHLVDQANQVRPRTLI